MKSASLGEAHLAQALWLLYSLAEVREFTHRGKRARGARLFCKLLTQLSANRLLPGPSPQTLILRIMFLAHEFLGLPLDFSHSLSLQKKE